MIRKFCGLGAQILIRSQEEDMTCTRLMPVGKQDRHKATVESGPILSLTVTFSVTGKANPISSVTRKDSQSILPLLIIHRLLGNDWVWKDKDKWPKFWKRDISFHKIQQIMGKAMLFQMWEGERLGWVFFPFPSPQCWGAHHWALAAGWLRD